jgi:hypothetical protein
MTPGLLHPAPSRPARPPASAQESTLDLLWIQDGVAAFAGGRGTSPLYRAVLALEGPPHTPRALAAAESGTLGGYRAVLDRLDHAVQVVVRALPVDTTAYAARWETRAALLPAPLAALAREHAGWARRELAGLGLLVRHAYMVVPAEEPPTAHSPAQSLRERLRRAPVSTLAVERARAVLAERCTRLVSGLGAAGVRAARLDDLDLARLYRACWSPSMPHADRFDRDLAAVFGRTS